MAQVPPSKYIAYRNLVESTKGAGGPTGALSQRAQGKKGKSSAFGKVLDDLDETKKDEKETDAKGSTRLAMTGGGGTPSTTNAPGAQGGAQSDVVEEKKKKVLKSEVVIVGSQQSTSLQNLNFKKTDDE